MNFTKTQAILGLCVTLITLSTTGYRLASEIARTRLEIETLRRDLVYLQVKVNENTARLNSNERWAARYFEHFRSVDE